MSGPHISLEFIDLGCWHVSIRPSYLESGALAV